MTTEKAFLREKQSSFAEGIGRSAEPETGFKASTVRDIPRNDTLQYIHEMCAALSYMSIAHDCDRLARLLEAAAVEAEQNLTTASAQPSDGAC
ncbi:MAG: hypothetical protein KKB37_12340 [Alphaproteobacteria bacterium]|nr:hypothetical protein [Alphaproteobacteria bacterium]